VTRSSQSGVGRVLWFITVYAILISCFLTTMTAVYALPQERILRNASLALDVFEREGVYAFPLIHHTAYQVDNYTEALMVDIAIRNDDDSPFYAAMAARYSGEMEPSATVTGLANTLAGNRGAGERYSYYWHGYQTWLRPMLAVMRYDQVRYVNLAVLTVLTLVAMQSVRRLAGTRTATMLLVSLLAVGLWVVPLCVHYSSVVWLTLLALIAVCSGWEKAWFPQKGPELFFVVGMVAPFVDLLTAPFLTFTLPLTLWLALEVQRGTLPLLKYARLAFMMGLAWALGYVASWATKWVLGSAVLGTDVVASALDQVRFRTATDGGPTGYVSAIMRPVVDLMPLVDVDAVSPLVPLSLVIIVAVGAILWFGRLTNMQRRSVRETLRDTSPLLVMVFLPHLWYVIVSNHTSIHHWFAYRGMATSVFACLVLCGLALDAAKRSARPGYVQGTH